jgi:hypothetical protein
MHTRSLQVVNRGTIAPVAQDPDTAYKRHR